MQLKKPSRRQVAAFCKYAMIVVAGNALASAASAFFLMPNDLVMGGTTGLGIFMRNLLGGENEWIVSLTVYAANILLFLIGAIFLGKKFAAATLAGTLIYPSCLSLFTFLNELYLKAHGNEAIASSEPILAAVCGSLLFGLGIGMVVRVGASTGGTDIPPLIFHKYFNLPVSVGLFVLDLGIVFIQLFAKVSLDLVLLGVVITLLSSFIVDKVSLIGTRRAQVKIISRKYKEIRAMILNDLNRGVTMLYGKTGFLQDNCYMLLTVVSMRDVVKLRNAVQAIDPEAFLMVSEISEVRGRGFSTDRIALPISEERSIEEEAAEREQNAPQETPQSASQDTPPSSSAS